MSHKSAQVAILISELQGGDWPARYLGFFACFNRGLFYEAHEVLEELWLPSRGRPEGLFYKGLIQLAGAFVHLQKSRLRPAGALLRLARKNLAAYPPVYQGIQTASVIRLIHDWLERLANSPGGRNPFQVSQPPCLDWPAARLRSCSKKSSVPPLL